MSRRTLRLLLVGIGVCLVCFERGEQDPYARYVVEGYEKIDRLALQEVPDRQLFQGAVEGMVGVLRERGDAHSQFFPERRSRIFQEEISQEIGGIGVRLNFAGDPPRLVVAGPPLPGKPADQAGIRDGDQILAIDGHSTAALSPRDMERVLAQMRGEPNEPLELTVLHPGETEPVTVTLVRELLTLDSVRGDRLLPDQSWQYRLEQDPRIALVRVTAFGMKSVGELEALLPKLLDDGAEALILDLRGNPGGPLEAAVETCELFLPADKLIVEMRDREGRIRRAEATTTDGPYLDVPLAVVVGRHSASASEIVAAALQDHDRAVVIGERTYGKGTVQEVFPMQGGKSLLKLTSASFWRPSGKNIHREATDREASLDDPDWGVVPDAGFEVPMTVEEYAALAERRAERDSTIYRPDDDAGEEELLADPAVDLAVAHLQQQLAD